MKITPKTTLKQMAAIVVEKLKEKKISAVLVGGAVVSIYTNNKYQSRDLDFISPADHRQIQEAMQELGFKTDQKDFTHPKTNLTVEFPKGPLAIGDDEPVKAEGRLKIGATTVSLLSPTQSVMDRLAWFYSNNDRQCLDQAVWIANVQDIKLEKVRQWSEREGASEKFEIFLGRLKATKQKEKRS